MLIISIIIMDGLLTKAGQETSQRLKIRWCSIQFPGKKTTRIIYICHKYTCTRLFSWDLNNCFIYLFNLDWSSWCYWADELKVRRDVQTHNYVKVIMSHKMISLISSHFSSSAPPTDAVLKSQTKMAAGDSSVLLWSFWMLIGSGGHWGWIGHIQRCSQNSKMLLYCNYLEMSNMPERTHFGLFIIFI